MEVNESNVTIFFRAYQKFHEKCDSMGLAKDHPERKTGFMDWLKVNMDAVSEMK